MGKCKEIDGYPADRVGDKYERGLCLRFFIVLLPISFVRFLLLKESHLNFYGNVEGDDIFKGTTDVVVCDGFVGNVALKTTEGVLRMFGNFLSAAYKKNFITKIIALISLSLLKSFRKRLDPRRYNGASFLGLNGIVIKSHGGADILAFKTAIITAIEESENRVLEKIKKQIKIESN